MITRSIPIILSGPSCVGKTTIARKLQETPDFSVVRAVTTRAKRSDDFNYLHVSMQEFEKKANRGEFLVSDSYRNNKYGILKKDYEKIDDMVHPVLILTSESAKKICEEIGAVWFFIDAEDVTLEKRFIERNEGSAGFDDNVKKQNESDRLLLQEATYVLKSTDDNLKSMVDLICFLVSSFHVGGGLSDRTIKLMLDCGMLLENANERSIKGASYDLLLGDEYYYDGDIKKLTNRKPFLTIEPYDYAIVSCKERAVIPRDVMGKFGLSVKLFCQGMILSNGPQIDPGFHGTLFCLLFNTSNRPIHLKRGEHYATIEFNKLVEPAQPYLGKYQNKKDIISYIPANALHGAINELKKEIEQLKNESRTMQNIYLAVVGLMFAVVSILLAIK